jgi:endonuclease YncB( thermonuclease family)
MTPFQSLLSRVAWFAGILTVASGAGAWAATGSLLNGKVVAVIDGDTIVVRDDNGKRHDIRVAGIDAPEIRQAYGPRARQHLNEMSFGKRVSVSWYKLDKYRRIIGRVHVMLPENCRGVACTHALDVALAQIEAGLAWHDTEHLTEQPVEAQRRYAHAERQARLQHRGLWAQLRPLPPWQYRHRYADSRRPLFH